MVTNLRYKITILVLIFSCGVVCPSFSQSVYDYKTKSNNVKDREIEQGLSSDWKGDFSSNRNNASSYSKPSRTSITSKIRLRFSRGSYSSDNKDVTNLTNNIIWNRLGMGQSIFKSEGNRSGSKYELENKKIVDVGYKRAKKILVGLNIK